MDWRQQTVLVTGAGGFIGSHLTEKLVELGARTRALIHYNSSGSWGFLDTSNVKNDIDVYLGDLRDAGSIKQAIHGVDIVFHLAALIAIPYSYQAPLSYVQTNVEGTLNLLSEANTAGVKRVIHTSTSEVYGTAQYVPIDEKHPLQGQSPYAASKIGADKMAEAFHLSFDLPVTTIRPFNTFGPRQSARAIIPTIVTQVLTRDELHLGNLDPTRDLNYVADTVEGFICMATSKASVGQVINVGSGKEISIGQLAKTIMGLLGKEIPIICKNERLRPEQSEVERLCADNRKAQKIIDWQPRINLEQGLSMTIDWIKQNLEQYRVGQYVV